jgi:phage terminase small subunit
MPILSNPRHERFCQYLAQGETAVDAYELAGYRRDDGNAVRLTKKPAIANRVQELTGLAAEKAKITVESLINRPTKFASARWNAVAAIREMSVLSGMRIERREIGAAGEFDHLSDEELERAIVERFRALGLSPRAGGDTPH